ncbi:ABC transporter permease [Microbacterium xanthum]|uniref:ABC transporter permease n=1 Tax=Microbacterium xanthum TaxID=3079794 RepID=UPI002AD3FDFC|nr:ABC transporter permease [Microbacterium sp. KSW-48]MDZ8171164.1 ABC transporter permease [Microbacterium sp. KSW-48]
MILFLIRRVLSGIAVLFVVSTLAFFLLYFSSQNVAQNILGEVATEEQIEQKTVELGLDRPLVERYVDWLSSALTGDFGTSWFTSQPVLDSILLRLPVTLSLVVLTTIVTAVVAVLVGVTAAVKRGAVDRSLQGVAIAGDAVPQFVMAVALVTLFALQLGWFPAIGYEPIADGVGPWIYSLTLPVAALAISAIASTAQQIRSSMISMLSMDWVRTLRSRGLSGNEILYRHVLRAAAPAGLTILSLHFINMLSGAVVIEQIFALPGVGFLALQASIIGDMPLLMGVLVYVVLVVIIVNLLVDLLVGWLNPKARVA